MFEFDDCRSQKLWNLSHSGDTEVVIPKDHLKLLEHYDLLAINFLYQNHRKNYKGAILNEQNGFNMQLQVAVFLNIMFRYIEQKFLTLVLAPDNLVAKWYQYLTDVAGLKTIKVNSKTCPQDFDDQHGVALLTSFEDIKLLDHLIGYNCFAVIVDGIDEVAKKPIIKNLCGDFHIGLTTRNFYFNPDQRLQWMMLNWCSPGCCGESKNFGKIDNDNFANFRDNYRHWWFRLTRHFCDSLKSVVAEEKVAKLKTITKKSTTNQRKKGKKAIRKEKLKKNFKPEEYMEAEPLESEEVKVEEVEQIDCETNNIVPEIKKEDLKKKSVEFKTNLSQIDDDDPINLLLPPSVNNSFQMKLSNELHTSKSGQEELPLKVEEVSLKVEKASIQTNAKDENCTDDQDDILLSLIDQESQKASSNQLSPESEIFFKKEELSTQIFSELPSTSTSLVEKEDSNDFFMSLID